MATRAVPIATLDVLLSESTLIQAWKKTERFSRTFNWYCDPLELDLGTALLPRLVDFLQRGVRSPDYRPTPLRVIPAPKADHWRVVGGQWRPDVSISGRLRPLAHVRVWDQMLWTAIALCLANRLETLQGRTDNARTVSFGNRLACTWSNGQARHRWASDKLFTEHYLDWRRFLARVERMTCPPARAVVHIDIARFYDRIDRDVLLQKLQTVEAGSGLAAPAQSTDFWAVVDRALKWSWADVDEHWVTELIGPAELRKGIPQGLVAGGFLANAYLVAFDEAVVRCIADQRATGLGFRILGYCRYVDDLRLTITWDDSRPPVVAAEVARFIDSLLALEAPGLSVNQDKVALTPISQGATSIRFAPEMQDIKVRLSGPVDLVSAVRVLDELSSLAGRTAVDQGTLPGPAEDLGLADEALRSLLLRRPDVKFDAVARFAANRWLRVYRVARTMIDGRGRRSPAVALDARAESFSADLTRRWVGDPSQLALLRVALELCPSRPVIETVLGVIEAGLARASSSSDGEARSVGAVAMFALADVFRTAGSRLSKTAAGDLPGPADLNHALARLDSVAESVLAGSRAMPWYVLQQATYYTVCRGKEGLLKDGSLSPNDTELRRYLWVLDVGRARDLAEGLETDVQLAVLVAHAVYSQDATAAGDRLKSLLMRRSSEEAAGLLDDVALMHSGVAAHAADDSLLPHVAAFSRFAAVLGERSHDCEAASCPSRFNGQFVSLSRLAHDAHNPLRDEITFVAFARALAQAVMSDATVADWIVPEQVEVRCLDWSRANDPASHQLGDYLIVRVAPRLTRRMAPYGPPAWCKTDGVRFAQQMGQILRAALVGTFDFTALLPSWNSVEGEAFTVRHRAHAADHWLRRTHALPNFRERLLGNDAPASEWICSLIGELLRWPGADYWTGLPEGAVADSAAFLRECNRRGAELMGAFARSARIPTYSFSVPPRSSDGNAGRASALTCLLAQAALPRHVAYLPLNGAITGGPTLSGPRFRPVHRAHLAAICQHIHEYAEVARSHGRTRPIDVVLLPELSVHQDDLPIVRILAHTLRAVVFCGLVFRDRIGFGLVNSGTWVVPRNRGGTLEIIQGKGFLTPEEVELGVRPFRPAQFLLDFGTAAAPCVATASICFDATDLALTADLRDRSDVYLISASNVDVGTFDTMVSALSFHMYQHVMLCNTGEFGGSAAHAPFHAHERVLAHHHGGNQVTITLVDVEARTFRGVRRRTRIVKGPPAGYSR